VSATTHETRYPKTEMGNSIFVMKTNAFMRKREEIQHTNMAPWGAEKVTFCHF
jgi:hypothetical protein